MPKPVFFLHVSSSGGTSVCQWAQSQPCARVPACGANCNLNCRHPWDWRNSCRPPACELPSRGCRPPHQAGCDGLVRYAERRNLSFLASETFLHEPPCLGHFRYIALLRDPVERIVSQLERTSAQPNTRLRELMNAPWVFNTSESSSLMGTAALDNYLTRLLLGAPVFFLPLRGINSSHLEAASQVLAAFAAAVPIDRLDEPATVSWLRTTLGWQGAPERRNSHHSSRHHHHERHQPGTHALGERSMRALVELNRHDRRLLSEARARLDAKVGAMVGAARGTTSSAPPHEQSVGEARGGASGSREERAWEGGERLGERAAACVRQCTTAKAAWHLGAARRRS